MILLLLKLMLAVILLCASLFFIGFGVVTAWFARDFRQLTLGLTLLSAAAWLLLQRHF